MRHPQSRNWLPAICAERQRRQIRQEQPGRHAELRPRGNKAAMMVGSRPLHRQQHRAAPLAADPDTLDEAQDRQDDRTPDADLRVGRDERHQKGRDAHQQQRRDQRRLAPDAVAVVTEDRRSDRAGDKADRVDAEGLQRPDQRIGFRKVQLGEDQPGDRAVQERNHTTRSWCRSCWRSPRAAIAPGARARKARLVAIPATVIEAPPHASPRSFLARPAGAEGTCVPGYGSTRRWRAK